ncbi:MAG: hypothetical protein M3N13_01840 [Candidatus Eremiobacteraeota bacterium]|nr:hypothetical protein [Candidatus Eremiobacteraeota bacterium]
MALPTGFYAHHRHDKTPCQASRRILDAVSKAALKIDVDVIYSPSPRRYRRRR